MQTVGTDILGPFSVSNSENSYILVATDYFTQWAEAYPIPNQEAGTIAKKLNCFCGSHPLNNCSQIRGAILNHACWQKYASC